MEALKTIQSTQNGVLHIEVPEHFNNTQLEVIVIPLHQKDIPGKDFRSSIKRYFGTARFSGNDVNKYDAYNQQSFFR